MEQNPVAFKITYPQNKKVGILLSIPHCGICFPNEIKKDYKTEMASFPDDTDWDLNKLYDFASEMGITTIEAVYSRWVIDLNRTPQNKSLYTDGRIITSLCPVTNFFGDPIYNSKEKEPSEKEIQRRLENYFNPYHDKVDVLLSELKNEFETVVFWDAHSIRRNVSTIQKSDFPDLILGNNDGLTADLNIIETALNSLKKSGLYLTHNTPFKGGYLTRSKGDPSNGIHALQLEMSKDLYMSQDESVYDFAKADKIKEHLKSVFRNLTSLIDG